MLFGAKFPRASTRDYDLTNDSEREPELIKSGILRVSRELSNKQTGATSYSIRARIIGRGYSKRDAHKPIPLPLPASIQSSPLRDAKMGKNKSRARSSEIYLLLVRKNFNSPRNRNSKIKIAQVCQKRYAQMTTIYIDR